MRVAPTSAEVMKSCPESSNRKRKPHRIVHQNQNIWCMGRTNIYIDDELIEEAMKMTGARSKREAVDLALRRLVEKGTLYQAIRRLRGQLDWQGDVDRWRSSRSKDS